MTKCRIMALSVTGWLVLCTSIHAQSLLAEPQSLPLFTGEWEPYVGKNLPAYGLIPEIINLACKEADLSPIYTFASWPRGQASLDEGSAWGGFPYVKTKERIEKYIFCEEPLWTETILVFYAKSNRELKADRELRKLEDLRGYKLGGARGYWYEEEFKRIGIDAAIVNTKEQAFTMLALGRVDYILEEELVGKLTIASLPEEFRERIGTLHAPFRQSNLYIMASRRFPKTRDLVAAFDRGLRAVKEGKEYKALLKRYGVLKE